jgi:UDP-N-acetylglucosamine diphosphorylase/glucosamine-1-phosphate N-acetyltransferase
MDRVPLYIFEDPGWRRFGPLTSLRPVWDIRIGRRTIIDRISSQLNRQPDRLFPREELRQLVNSQNDTKHVPINNLKVDVFIVNGRTVGELPSNGLLKETEWSIWTEGQEVVAARLPLDVATKWMTLPVINPSDYSVDALVSIWSQMYTTPQIKIREVSSRLLWWPWDLLNNLKKTIEGDYKELGQSVIEGDVHPKAILVDEFSMNIAVGSKIDAGAILDASKGPIIIEDGVHILPGAIIMGPVVLGKNSIVKAGAKIYGPVATGPVCKLGGEIEDTIFFGYSNKQHEGFLGHALVGEWVNLGADTNNSDLKNNYSDVSVTIQGETIQTGSTFFGSIIGDHVKTAINTQLNTGTVIGVGTNIFGPGFPPKAIGAFRWGGATGFEFYDFNKFIYTAKAVMGRRDVELTSEMNSVLKQINADALAGLQ